MADLITSFTGSDGLIDNRVRVVSSSLARQMSIGNNWKILRIAIRYVTEDTKADIINNPCVAFGLCSGTSSIFNLSGSNANHFLGLCSRDSTNSNANPQSFVSNSVYVTGGTLPNYYNVYGLNNSPTTTYTWFVQTGSAIISNFTGPNVGNIAGTSSFRTGVMLQYSRSATGIINLQCAGMGYIAFGNGSDLTIGQLERWVTQVNPVYNPTAYNALTSIGNYAVSESLYGPLDTINFYWNKPYPSFFVSDIIAAKII